MAYSTRTVLLLTLLASCLIFIRVSDAAVGDVYTDEYRDVLFKKQAEYTTQSLANGTNESYNRVFNKVVNMIKEYNDVDEATITAAVKAAMITTKFSPGLPDHLMVCTGPTSNIIIECPAGNADSINIDTENTHDIPAILKVLNAQFVIPNTNPNTRVVAVSGDLNALTRRLHNNIPEHMILNRAGGPALEDLDIRIVDSIEEFDGGRVFIRTPENVLHCKRYDDGVNGVYVDGQFRAVKPIYACISPNF